MPLSPTSIASASSSSVSQADAAPAPLTVPEVLGHDELPSPKAEPPRKRQRTRTLIGLVEEEPSSTASASTSTLASPFQASNFSMVTSTPSQGMIHLRTLTASGSMHLPTTPEGLPHYDHASSPEIGHGPRPADKPEQNFVRHGRFYIPEADCVLLVGKTLFKVHRFLLARDSSAFQDMFTLPPDESYDAAQLEGSSDENPIVLFGESADDFAILLDALYALPPQLAAFHSNTAPLDVLLTLTSLLNKYQFSTTCEWALVALYRVVSGHYGTPPAIEDISLLERIVEVACVCNYAELREWVEEKWISRILQSPGGWAEREARFAINAADTWGLKKLGAMAYYSLLLESNDKISPTYSPPQGVGAEDEASQPPPLSSSQIFRALSGHMSLVNLWETIRISPPTFARPEGCVFHSQGCVSAWSSAWAEAVRSELTLGRHKSCHVLGRLKVIEDQLTANTDLQCALTPACRRRAIAAVRELHAKVVHELPQHFQNDMAVA